jgi:hypothetical protein
MASRAANAAPIQTVLRESGIQRTPFHSWIEDLTLLMTPPEPQLFPVPCHCAASAGSHHAVPFGPYELTEGRPEWHSPSGSSRKTGRPPTRPVLHTAVPSWQAGDTIPLSADWTLRVVETRFADDDPVLVVETA